MEIKLSDVRWLGVYGEKSKVMKVKEKIESSIYFSILEQAKRVNCNGDKLSLKSGILMAIHFGSSRTTFLELRCM
jgi:hypothetical protein